MGSTLVQAFFSHLLKLRTNFEDPSLNLIVIGITFFSCCPPGWVSDGISSYYMLRRRYKKMADARQQCQNLGADLPIISAAKENNFIADLLAKESKGWSWLGLQLNISDLEFYWVSGSKLEGKNHASNDEEPNNFGGVEGKYQAWNDGEPNSGGGVEGKFHEWNYGEPNNSGGVEYCAYIMGKVSHKGKWNDCRCKFAAYIVSPYVLCQKAI